VAKNFIKNIYIVRKSVLIYFVEAIFVNIPIHTLWLLIKLLKLKTLHY